MKHLNTVAATLGAALLTSVTWSAQAAQNPFSAQELSSGYSLAAHEKDHEGACGEGKCGGEMKSTQGDTEATKGEKTAAEGKCGEGKCGADKQG
ncbi:hypothetical protein BZL41_10985 [Pseudomonas sp. PIC25]|uniref:HvfA family oxazolone/thioamide-modified RiPP metallophore n=1 Tax=Pseudomonas sp. PIC25 TaxID=1958773 RepID=UPI000BAB52D8|nr:hypothetical protein [Pseudomonas sp. PIC25]PAU64134.1 hypothetical protein BZL41_10985 [Pseudomonas sp. PIC25]